MYTMWTVKRSLEIPGEIFPAKMFLLARPEEKVE
jgi:hypothetical protein